MAKIQGINVVAPGSDQNIIINGDMKVAQRGASFVAIATSTYHLDRWQYFKTGTVVHTITQDTDVPTITQAGRQFSHSLKLDCTTADASIAAADNAQFTQRVEGYNVAKLVGKPFTLSFWVKATKTGIYSVGFKNGASGTDRCYVGEYTVNTTLTWEYKTITVPTPPTSGTWNYTTGLGLNVVFSLAAGTDTQTAPGVWTTGNFSASTNQVNGVDSTANDFWITGIMLNSSIAAAPFSLFGKDAGGEFIACKRYYEKSYEAEIAPGTVTGEGANRINIVNVGASVDASNVFFFKYTVEKRVDPTLTLWNPEVLNSSGSIPYEPGATGTSPTVNNNAQTGYTITHSMGVADDDHGTFHHYTADSEL